jgi:acetolactate synthase-1/2/3 large subunit
MVSTLMGLGAVGAAHPQFLGLTGMHGSKTANHAIYEADLVIAVGSRFNDRVTGDRNRYASGKTVIHIDVDPAEIDKNVVAHIGLLGDLSTLLDLLTEKLEPCDMAAWWQQIRAWQKEFTVTYEDKTLNVPWVMHTINEQTKNQPYIFVTDVGQQQMWAAQHLKIDEPRTWITSGGLGTMGFGLPAAIGAQIAEPQKRVVHIAGDGGFKMTGMELYTVACQKLPIISIIINNSTLGMVRQWQTLFFGKRYSATSLPQEMDFAVLAQAFHIESAVVNTPQEFAAAFDKAQAADKPYLIVVTIDQDDMVMPMIAPGAALNEYTTCESLR